MEHLDSEFLEKNKKLLRKIFVKVASAETSCNEQLYKKKKLKSPLFLHCGAVSTVMHGLFGGDIVTGKIKGTTHYWNRLPSGIEVDFTSCQFGGDGFSPLKKGRKVKPRKLVNPRFLLFAEKVLKKLRQV